MNLFRFHRSRFCSRLKLRRVELTSELALLGENLPVASRASSNVLRQKTFKAEQDDRHALKGLNPPLPSPLRGCFLVLPKKQVKNVQLLDKIFHCGCPWNYLVSLQTTLTNIYDDKFGMRRKRG